MKLLILTISLLYICVLSNGKRVRNLSGKNNFVKTDLIYGHQPLSGKTLLSAACDRNSSCSVTLTIFPENKEEWEAHACQVSYQPKDESFQLRHLYAEQIAITQNDSLRIINMKNCKITKHELNLSNGAHIIPYTDSFDIFYRNETRCGKYMCGIAFDDKGEVIIGPTETYVPVRFLKVDTSVCSVKSGSSRLGHFLLSSSEFRMVSSFYGKVTELMKYPSAVEAHAFSCSNDFLGFCWLSKFNNKEVKCIQYDINGNLASSTTVSLDYQTGTWLAMANLGEGDMLLLTNECNDENWCLQNVDSVEFHLHRVYGTDDSVPIHKFHGFDCKNPKDLKTEVYRKSNGDICVTLACHKDLDVDRSEENFMSTCISNW